MLPVDVVAVLHAGHRRAGYGPTGGHSSFYTRGPEMVEKLWRGVDRYVPAAQSLILLTNHPHYDGWVNRDGRNWNGVLQGDHRRLPIHVGNLKHEDVATGWWSKTYNALRDDIPMKTRRRLYIDLDNVLGPRELTPLTNLPLRCDEDGAPIAYMPDDRVYPGSVNGSAMLFDAYAPEVQDMVKQFDADPIGTVRRYPPTGAPGARGAGCDQPFYEDVIGRQNIELMQDHVPPGLIGHAKLDLTNPNGSARDFDHSNVGMMVGWWIIDPIERPDLRYYKEQWT